MVRFDKYILDYCICFLVGLVSDIQIIYYFHVTVYNYVHTIVLKTFCKCFCIFSISRPLKLIKIYNFLPLRTPTFFVFSIPTNSMKILLYIFTPLCNRKRPSKHQRDHLLFHSRVFLVEMLQFTRVLYNFPIMIIKLNYCLFKMLLRNWWVKIFNFKHDEHKTFSIIIAFDPINKFLCAFPLVKMNWITEIYESFI